MIYIEQKYIDGLSHVFDGYSPEEVLEMQTFSSYTTHLKPSIHDHIIDMCRVMRADNKSCPDCPLRLCNMREDGENPCARYQESDPYSVSRQELVEVLFKLGVFDDVDEVFGIDSDSLDNIL